jgi:hypothetical protein
MEAFWFAGHVDLAVQLHVNYTTAFQLMAGCPGRSTCTCRCSRFRVASLRPELVRRLLLSALRTPPLAAWPGAPRTFLHQVLCAV